MTATEVLRCLLDERGVEWEDGGNGATYVEHNGEAWRFDYDEPFDQLGIVCLSGYTPEQAIAATLGSCSCSDNCTNSERTETCEMEYVSDWMSWHCKACGQMSMAPRNPKPRYCKWCGRKVVEPTTNDVDAEVDDG